MPWRPRRCPTSTPTCCAKPTNRHPATPPAATKALALLVLMLAGAALTTPSAVNGQLRGTLHSVVWAVLISCLLLLCLAAATGPLVAGSLRPTRRPWAPCRGALADGGGASRFALVVARQLPTALACDQFGLPGLSRSSFSPAKPAGGVFTNRAWLRATPPSLPAPRAGKNGAATTWSLGAWWPPPPPVPCWAALSPVPSRSVSEGVAEVNVAAEARGQGPSSCWGPWWPPPKPRACRRCQASTFPENTASLALHALSFIE